jgi:hypothetical protein
MRQVKFLLDYDGAREFEYQLARGCRSANGMANCEGTDLVTPVCLTPHDCTTTVDTNLCISFPYLRSLSENGTQVHLKPSPHLRFPFTFAALQTSRYIPYPGFQAIGRCVRTTSILIHERTTLNHHPPHLSLASRGNSRNMTAMLTLWVAFLLSDTTDSAQCRTQRGMKRFLMLVSSILIRNRSIVWLWLA